MRKGETAPKKGQRDEYVYSFNEVKNEKKKGSRAQEYYCKITMKKNMLVN